MSALGGLGSVHVHVAAAWVLVNVNIHECLCLLIHVRTCTSLSYIHGYICRVRTHDVVITGRSVNLLHMPCKLLHLKHVSQQGLLSLLAHVHTGAMHLVASCR